MYTVVIIDDEPIIVRGLEKTVKWENWECMVAGTAFNGAEGMGLIRRERPDMLISDICMPEMDGLSMIAALKSEFPDMEITILTGYRDFDYAREAIRLGVCRFLLKPSKMDELNEAIEAMIERLKGRAELRREGNAFGKEKVEDGAAGCTGKGRRMELQRIGQEQIYSQRNPLPGKKGRKTRTGKKGWKAPQAALSSRMPLHISRQIIKNG